MINGNNNMQSEILYHFSLLLFQTKQKHNIVISCCFMAVYSFSTDAIWQYMDKNELKKNTVSS